MLTKRDQLIAKAREDAIKAAAKAIPNFTDERRTALESLALELGADQADVKSIMHPSVYRVLHYADIGRKFEARQRKAAKVESAQASSPVPEVSGRKAVARKDPSKMSPEEYHAMRLKQRMG